MIVEVDNRFLMKSLRLFDVLRGWAKEIRVHRVNPAFFCSRDCHAMITDHIDLIDS